MEYLAARTNIDRISKDPDQLGVDFGDTLLFRRSSPRHVIVIPMSIFTEKLFGFVKSVIKFLL